MIASQMWWEQVPAAEGLLRQIASALRNGCSILLDGRCAVWQEEMRRHVHAAVTEIGNAMHFERIDASSCPQELTPDAFLLQQIGEADLYGTQLMRLRQLRRKPACLWIDGICEGQQEAWIDMMAELMQEETDMLLILNIPDYPYEVTADGVVQLVAGYTRFDVYCFAIMQISGKEIDPRLQEYAATLCTEVSALEPELCARLCDVAHRLMEDPEHVASCLIPGVDVRADVLRAQLRALMPLVELCRVTIIDILADRLQAALPYSTGPSSGITEIGGFELRHIVNLMNNGLLPMNDELCNLAQRFRETRNDIAHLRPLSYEAIMKFCERMERLDALHDAALRGE